MRAFIFLAICFLLFSGSAYAGPPERIVSLAPNMTEILYALNLEDRIVAVTSFCDYPPQAKDKPTIGGMSNPSLEAIIDARPDIVMITTDGNQKGIEVRLQQLGVRTYIFTATQIAELPQAIRYLGQALEIKEEAERLASRIDSTMQTFRVRGENWSAARDFAMSKKAIFIIWPEPLVVAGRGTAVDDVLRLLGWENIAAGAGSRYPKYSIEEIIHQSPEVIFIGKMLDDMEGLSKNILKRLSMLEAVQEGRVYYTSDALYRLGPRVIEGTEELAGYLLQN